MVFFEKNVLHFHLNKKSAEVSTYRPYEYKDALYKKWFFFGEKHLNFRYNMQVLVALVISFWLSIQWYLFKTGTSTFSVSIERAYFSAHSTSNILSSHIRKFSTKYSNSLFTIKIFKLRYHSNTYNESKPGVL